ncbi:MAG: hypothetical protein Q9227_001783 [Pyrenula ochraceoflavens]
MPSYFTNMIDCMISQGPVTTSDDNEQLHRTPLVNDVNADKILADWNPENYEVAKNADVATAFCAAKAMAERTAFEYIRHKKPHFSIATICPPMIFGPLQPGVTSTADLSPSAADVYRLINGNSKEIPPTAFWAYCDVRDVADAHLKAFENPKAANQRFFVTGGRFSYQMACDALRMIPDIQDNVPAGIPGSRVLEHAYNVDGSKAQKVLGIQYRSLDDSIRDMAKSLMDLERASETRAALEDEYARKLLQLCRKPLGSQESGTLRASLDVVRGEVEATGKSHAQIAAQMKSELEEPLTAFAGGMKERRKIVQGGIEKLHKLKQQQTQHVNRSRDRYEQDTLKIKGYMAQGHMVMGQEERKNKAKLEKTQINMSSNSNEYEAAVKTLEDTTGRWNKDWKAACDKFQDLEEERIDFTKSSLWSFANIASTVCVTDDASCEKIRVSLEGCEVEKDISSFIRERGTGQEIPDPPKFINFCRGDKNPDTVSEASEDENYSVAQFQRTINPAFRSSSPNPSTYESHHDPHSELAKQMGHGLPNGSSPASEAQPAPLDFRRSNSSQPSQHSLPPGYQSSQHGDIAKVPHNEYPSDGMTMFCRAGPPSTTGSGLTRPSSRDSESEYSNPTSFSSADPISGKSSPVKTSAPVNGVEMPGMGPSSPDKSLQKKRSGFFSNSPFRRKSKHEKEFNTPNTSNRNTWAPASRPGTSAGNSPTKRPNLFSRPNTNADADTHAEPVDPRASFQLNVGNNVFDVASPDSQSTPRASQNGRRGLAQVAGDDPVAAALEELRGVSKQSSTRVSADIYHGLKTPAPERQAERPAPLSAASSDRMAAQRGTPPPAYAGPGGLGVPQPAFTAKEMNARKNEYTSGYGGPVSRGAQSRPGTRDGNVPRAASPQPVRARSPGPAMMMNGGRQSPNPAMMMNGSAGGRARGQSVSPQKSGAGSWGQNSRHNSPQSGMEMQLAQNSVESYGGGNGSGRGRPRSAFGGDPYGQSQSQQQGMRGGSGGYGGNGMSSADRRERSKSMAAPAKGPGVLHFARALYSYTAAIPEELAFSKGDILAVLRLQDDGWWEAEIRESKAGRTGGRGLVPSNYLARC